MNNYFKGIFCILAVSALLVGSSVGYSADESSITTEEGIKITTSLVEVDVNQNGIVTPGESLQYKVTLENTSDIAVSDINVGLQDGTSQILNGEGNLDYSIDYDADGVNENLLDGFSIPTIEAGKKERFAMYIHTKGNVDQNINYSEDIVMNLGVDEVVLTNKIATGKAIIAHERTLNPGCNGQNICPLENGSNFLGTYTMTNNGSATSSVIGSIALISDETGLESLMSNNLVLTASNNAEIKKSEELSPEGVSVVEYSFIFNLAVGEEVTITADYIFDASTNPENSIYANTLQSAIKYTNTTSYDGGIGEAYSSIGFAEGDPLPPINTEDPESEKPETEKLEAKEDEDIVVTPSSEQKDESKVSPVIQDTGASYGVFVIALLVAMLGLVGLKKINN